MLQRRWKEREQEGEARPRNQAEPGNYSWRVRTGFAERGGVGGGRISKRTWLQDDNQQLPVGGWKETGHF